MKEPLLIQLGTPGRDIMRMEINQNVSLRMTVNRALAAVAAAVVFFTAPSALALGLGGPIASPVLSQPMRIEIALVIGVNEQPLTIDCVHLAPPLEGSDTQFFPKQAKLSLSSSGPARIIITSPQRVHDPFFEFRIVLGCNGEISRDYLVLTRQTESGNVATQSSSVSATPTAEAVAIQPTNSASTANTDPAATAAPSASPAKAVISAAAQPGSQALEGTLTLRRNTTLNALARWRYPRNREARDEYKRLMTLANPMLFGEPARAGSVPLAAGTILNVPPKLPPRDGAPSIGRTKSVSVRPSSTEQSVAPASSPPKSDTKISVSQDRLVIGGGSGTNSSRPLSAKQAAATIERLEQMLLAQTSVEQEVNEKLRSLEALLKSSNSQLQVLDAKSKQQEVEQRQLQAKLDAKPEPREFGLVELLALIVTCGAIGAGLLALSHRLQMQRNGITGATSEIRNPTNITAHTIFGKSPATPNGKLDEDAWPFSKMSRSADAELPIPRQTTSLQTTRSPDITQTKTSPKLHDTPENSATHSKTPPAVAPLSPISAPVKTAAPPEQSSQHLVTRPPVANDAVEFTLPLFSEPPSVVPSPPSEPSLAAQTSGSTWEFDLARLALAEIEAATAIEVGSGEDPAVELANIMISMGMRTDAERTLIDYILEDPKRGLGPWLKALEIYRKSGRRDEFEKLAISLRQHLNVAADAWDVAPAITRPTLEEFSRISETVQRLWPTTEAETYLASLLGDNRDGSRAGFPQAVAEDILWLMRILRARSELT